jgi:hypothetical protein
MVFDDAEVDGMFNPPRQGQSVARFLGLLTIPSLSAADKGNVVRANNLSEISAEVGLRSVHRPLILPTA